MSDAASVLMAGGLVAFPTETVYGLGADACNPAAVARIYSVKGRPADHPLIVHVASMDGLGDWARDVPTYAIALARDYWPGPMTLIVPRTDLAGDFVTGGQDTVGVRVPAHPVALGLLEAFVAAGGKGVAAPSANRFGNVSPTTANAVAAELGDYLADGDQILDGGACDVGVESTIIDCTGDTPKILRPGAITVEMIEQSTGLTVVGSVEEPEIRVSGSLDSHYSPAAKLYWIIPRRLVKDLLQWQMLWQQKVLCGWPHQEHMKSLRKSYMQRCAQQMSRAYQLLLCNSLWAMALQLQSVTG